MIGMGFLWCLLAAAPVPDLGPGTVVVAVPWGTDGAALGRRDGNESNPEGPMSFAVSPLGEVWVLDQVNARVVRFGPDGGYREAVPLPATTFQDLEVAPDGRLLVLDRLVRGTVLVLDPGAGQGREHGIAGPGVEEGGGVTALLARDDGVWLEYAHAHSVRILGPDLEPCTRTLVAGRPSWRPGETLVAARDARGAADVRLRAADGSERAAMRIENPEPVSRIAWVEDDPAAGRIVAAFHVLQYDEGGRILRTEYDGVRVWDRRGRLRATLRSPWVITEWEQLREFDVAADGSVWQMAFAADGVRILRWNP